MKRLSISVVFVVCLLILVIKVAAQKQESLYRGSEHRHANFVEHPRTFLDASPIAIKRVHDALYCAFNCLRKGRCFSYNVAVFPDADDKYECQLLATDKYNSSHNLKSTQQFNHHSILSPCEASPCQNGGMCRPVYEKEEYKCKCAPGFSGTDCKKVVASCKLLKELGVTKDGVYTIKPDEQGPLKVYCDQTTDGGGWTVLQRRRSPFKTSFNRNWEEYRTGFGNLTGEFWLGNDNIHRLAAAPVSFRVDFQENGGSKRYARYENFVVAGADDKYRWNMDSFSGDLPNAIYGSQHAYRKETGMQFSTPDKDNDMKHPGKCSPSSGWWVNGCGLVNLNAVNGPKWSQVPHPGTSWQGSFSEMKVRPN